MRLLSSESYNVAWFKLADFVARGEKERALNVHKLLMHSVDEEAFAYQLEGDILLCFDDEGALGKYHVAANLYKKKEMFNRAIAVYRHVLLFKEDSSIIEALLDVYHLLHDSEHIVETFFLFAQSCVKQANVGLLFNRLHSFVMYPDKVVYADLHAAIVEAFLLHDPESKQMKMYIQQTVDLYKECENEKALKAFDKKIKAFNGVCIKN